MPQSVEHLEYVLGQVMGITKRLTVMNTNLLLQNHTVIQQHT